LDEEEAGLNRDEGQAGLNSYGGEAGCDKEGKEGKNVVKKTCEMHGDKREETLEH
jgi:hypothetical protein